MKKTGVIVVGILVVIIGLFYALGVKMEHIVDWEESFNEKSNTPYGVSVFYKELPRLFKDKKVRTVYYTPSTYLYANSEDGYGDHEAEGVYMIIGNSDYLDSYDIEELLDFTSNGNTLFISDYFIPQKLLDTLNLSIIYKDKIKDSTAVFGFNTRNLKHKESKIDKLDGISFFDTYYNTSYKALGHVKDSVNLTNYIEIPFEEGKILMHLEPKAFTNYNILKENRYTYTEGIISYLPTKNIYFDSYTKLYDSYYGDVEEKSNLSWFLEQLAFRWAWYLALILTLLFIIFTAKRRQRIIKTIKPLENTTLGFVKTISNLYFETEDHKNIVQKKITYFLEKIRTDYNIDTSNLDEEFIELLVSKSGKNKDTVTKLINYINWLRTKNEFFEDNLIHLNRHIEAFYSK